KIRRAHKKTAMPISVRAKSDLRLLLPSYTIRISWKYQRFWKHLISLPSKIQRKRSRLTAAKLRCSETASFLKNLRNISRTTTKKTCRKIRQVFTHLGGFEPPHP